MKTNASGGPVCNKGTNAMAHNTGDGCGSGGWAGASKIANACKNTGGSPVMDNGCIDGSNPQTV